MKATAKARSNIALVKYWGKRDTRLNLPAVGSISITLDALATETHVELGENLEHDSLVLNGERGGGGLARVTACLDILREMAGTTCRARVESANNFPTAAGLASSASGFAALVGAAARALGLELDDKSLSILARRGSGSAARSIFGGFVEMHAGRTSDGLDSFAEPIMDRSAWPLEVVVAVTERGPKDTSSGSGMLRSAESSPYYSAWVASHPPDLDAARAAIVGRDFEALAAVSESSCLKMHAAAIAAVPPLVYWNGVTLECMKRVRELRKLGTGVFFTIDAGPQLKAVCVPGAASRVAEALGDIPGVVDTIRTGLGPGLEYGGLDS